MLVQPAITKPGRRASIAMARHGVAEVLTGATVLIVAGAFLAFAIAHSGRTSGTGYELQARFDHIDGLNVGGDVRIAGVKVGTVTDAHIDPKTFSAVVTLTVRNGLELPKDTAATITSESLLGGKYISLSPGGDDTDLKPGQTISITQSSVSLEELLGKFIFSVTTLNNAKGGQSDGKTDGGEQPQTGSRRRRPGAIAKVIPPPPTNWPGLDGNAVGCREKLKMLAENYAEVSEVLRDAFEDAVLMGVNETAMRQIFSDIVAGLESPKRTTK